MRLKHAAYVAPFQLPQEDGPFTPMTKARGTQGRDWMEVLGKEHVKISPMSFAQEGLLDT